MDAHRFDAFSRSLADRSSRRTMLGLSVAGGLAALLGLADAEAGKKGNKQKKKCKGGKRKCGKKCIPKSNCCTSADCDEGETCQNGACVCPSNVSCASGGCCATGQTCIGDACQACPLGPGLCEGTTLICGVTPLGNPCICTTTLGGATACIGGAVLLEPVYCTNCDSDADCEEFLGLPGQAVCVGDVDCDFFCGDVATGCAVNGCVAVEFCDSDEDCSAGTCITHRCQ